MSELTPPPRSCAAHSHFNSDSCSACQVEIAYANGFAAGEQGYSQRILSTRCPAHVECQAHCNACSIAAAYANGIKAGSAARTRTIPKGEAHTSYEAWKESASLGTPEMPPSPWCETHPGGTPEDCQSCGSARLAFQIALEAQRGIRHPATAAMPRESKRCSRDNTEPEVMLSAIRVALSRDEKAEHITIGFAGNDISLILPIGLDVATQGVPTSEFNGGAVVMELNLTSHAGPSQSVVNVSFRHYPGTDAEDRAAES